MRRNVLLAAALWLAAASCAVVAAPAPQPGPPQRPPNEQGIVARWTTELGLSKKQADSISAIMEKTREEMRKIHASKESDEAKRRKMDAMQTESRKKVNAVLTPAQRKKLEQMIESRRPMGPGFRPGEMRRGPGFANRVRFVLQDLKLTQTQKSKTDAALTDFEKKADAIKSDPKNTREQRLQKMDALRRATLAKVSAALNADQQKKLKERMPDFFVKPGPRGK